MTENDIPNEKSPLVLPGLISRATSNDSGAELTDGTTRNRYIAPFIIVVLLERFSYYSIIVNLFLFFKDNVYHDDDHDKNKNSALGNGPKAAIISVMVLIGLSWMFCVLGGWLSDVKFGKLKTIMWGLVIYTFGTGLLFASAYCTEYTTLAFDGKALYRAIFVFASIFIIVIGEGAYKANIAAFGAEQLDKKDPISTRRYFNFYFFSLNIGVLLALSVSAYIQQRKGFTTGFAIPFVTITLALFVFVLSRKRYKTLPCQRVVGKVFQIVREARRNRKRNGRSNSALMLQQYLSWFDHARMKYGGSFLDWEVDQVRFLFAVIPVFVVLLPYQIIYNQMGATFLQQGIHMNLNFGDFKFFPVAWLHLFDAVVIVVLVPIMEQFVYPWLTKRGYQMVPLTRISIGILMSCFAIIAAGFVEIYIVEDFKKNQTVMNHNVNFHNVTGAKLSVFYQLPQYVLIGVSEVFAAVGGLEFAYRNAPPSMQAIVMSLFFAVISLGSLLGSGLLELSEVLGIITRQRKAHDYYDLTYYFFLLAALMLLSWIIFILYIERNRRKRLKLRRVRMFDRARRAKSPDIYDAPDESYYNG